MTNPTAVPAKKAARRVLSRQFAAVRKHLLLVFEHPTEAERIHKLRVAVRRATAALDAFARCLPRKDYKHARRVLRTIRRTAGAARDWDVFFPVVADWESGQPEAVRPFADALLGWSASKRDSAQAALTALSDTFPAALDALSDDTLAALRRPKGDLSVADLGRQRVETLRAELTAASAHEPTSDAEYHEVRIAAKRLRYAAELFAEHTPDAERIDADMRALQEVLGRFNDGVVGATHLGEFARHFQKFHPAAWERLRAGADALGDHFTAVREAERARFREWRSQSTPHPAGAVG
jgi:CHAD domain-containing protein